MFQGTENLQCIKKVLIEKQGAHYDSDDSIVAPVIRIERQNLESSARSVHEYVLPLDKAWEFPRENLKLGKVSTLMEKSRQCNCSLNWLTQLLGMGNFGKVMQATASVNNGETITVAVKMLKENHTDQVRLFQLI